MSTPNANNKPAADKRKANNHKAAVTFAYTEKTMLKTPKRPLLIALMAKFGIKIREAKAIYKALK